MKPYLPYNVLLILALGTGGLLLLYNLVLRESFETTIHYSYPAIEQAVEVREEPVDPVRFYPEEEAEPDAVPEVQEEFDQPEEPEEEAALTSVRFPLDINEATVEQLKFIPRVGDVTAQRIVQYREHIGGYTDLEQLKNIKGIGDATYERLWQYFYIGEGYDAEDAEDESSQEEAESEEVNDMPDETD